MACRERIWDGNNISQEVSLKLLGVFNSLDCKSGKPTTRSNGVVEWTVLAGIAALHYVDDELQVIPICIATGVKSLPDKVRDFSQGLLVHDCHAEVLALRLFNHYLVNECKKISNHDGLADESLVEILDQSKKLFRIKEGIRLALLITEPPCGDASVGYLRENLKDCEPWEETLPHKRQKLDEHVGGRNEKLSTLKRGRDNFGILGVVRTKPGRSDSEISLSKSCSDKLCLKQLIGVTNAITSHLFPENVFLDYLVLPHDKIKERDINRCFIERFELKQKEAIHHLKVLGYDNNILEFEKPQKDRTKESMVPSAQSLLYIVPLKTLQVLNNGMKNGSYRKLKPPTSGGESIICNRLLYKQAQDLITLDADFYLEFKSKNPQREDLKKEGKTALKGWISTSSDDFKLL